MPVKYAAPPLVIVPTGMITYSSESVNVVVPESSRDCIVEALREYHTLQPTVLLEDGKLEEAVMSSAVFCSAPSKGITRITALAGSNGKLKYQPLAELRLNGHGLELTIHAYETILCNPQPLYTLAKRHKI